MYTFSVPHDKTRIHFKHYDKHSFLSKKLLFFFSLIARETRWREEDSLLPCILSCLTFIIYDCSLDTVSYVQFVS